MPDSSNSYQTVIDHIWNALNQELSSESVVLKDEPLAKKTTWRVGGSSDIYVTPSDEASLQSVMRLCTKSHVNTFVLGRGSNVLVRDGGFRGVTISLTHPYFQRVEMEDELIWAGAGARQKDVALFARKSGLAGFEFLEGIPGSIGGGLRMNAGAMGMEMFDRVQLIRVLRPYGEIVNLARNQIEAHYRRCPLLEDHLALGAWFNGSKDSPEAIAERMRVYSEKRWASQPAASSAGCVFKNPDSMPAGKLVDELGLKGLRVGGACVSDVHGNFIVNDQKATANDILNLIAKIQKIAIDQRGVQLLTEIKVVGEDAI